MTAGARLKRLARSLLGRAPGLRRVLRAALLRLRPLPPRRMHVPLDGKDLSPSAQAAYDALKQRFRSGKR
jgi:hypothetical protein